MLIMLAIAIERLLIVIYLDIVCNLIIVINSDFQNVLHIQPPLPIIILNKGHHYTLENQQKCQFCMHESKLLFFLFFAYKLNLI